jgi:hypothetical protein
VSVLEQFARQWGLKIEGERIPGAYGFITEHNGELRVWTHTYSPGGHQFFPTVTGFDEIKAMIQMVDPEGGIW